jgi:molybdopterin-containing oxidoreductase family iron-sulfur binding subunit
MALNGALGSLGTAVELLDTGEEALPPQADALAALVADMNAGNVDALFLLDVNPVYDTPAALGFAEAMGKVGETVHLGFYVDETAQAARWHLPLAHYLEAWGDGRTYDGTLTPIQPLIAPLYDDARSEIEVLALLAAGTEQAGYDLVRARWRAAGVLPGDFEEGWRRVLHDGFAAGTAYPTVAAAPAAPRLTLPPAAGDDALEVVFRLDEKVLDGRFANNAWCQELSDPVTKVSWDNVAVMSRRTAERLGLEMVYDSGKYQVSPAELRVGERTVTLPVWILPGHPDNSIGVTCGYGRSLRSERARRTSPFWDLDSYTDVFARGPLANEVGVNVAPLRPTASTHVVLGAEVRPAGGRYMVASTQDHAVLDLEARPLFRMGTLEEYRRNPHFPHGEAEDMPPPGEAPREYPGDPYPELWNERHPSDQPEMKGQPYYRNQWGMVIDLNTCTGCNACVLACTSENNVPVVGKVEVARGREMFWLRVDRYFVSHGSDEAVEASDSPEMVLQPLPCMHCENAPCEAVCPVAATTHSSDGLNEMTYNRCIGTRYCSNNCPYKVRHFNYFNWTKTLPLTVQMAMNPDVTVRFRGVMEKCTFCVQRIRGAQRQAKLENRLVREGEVQTACAQACPADAIFFGDLLNPESEVSVLKRNPLNYTMLEELDTEPRVSYLAQVRNPNPGLSETAT